MGRLAYLTRPQHFVAQLKNFKTCLRLFSLSPLKRMVTLVWVVIFFQEGFWGIGMGSGDNTRQRILGFWENILDFTGHLDD